MSRRELAIALLLVMGLLAPLIEIPIANAIIPQDQTISIVNTRDDKWTTGTGAIGIDSWLVHVLDPGYDVYSWTIFRDVEINNWEPLKNATLRLYTGNTLDFDKESIITIYGMKVDELQNILPIGPSYAVSVPKTDHYVNFNTSQFYGPSKWWDIDVTAIVEELIRAQNWDGDGLTSGDIGDAIGFVMLGVKGHDVRYFVDYRSDPALSAQLVIHWNHQPPLNDPPTGDNDFVEQYRNYSIWINYGSVGYPLDPMEYIFTSGSVSPYNVSYDTYHTAPATPILISTTEDSTSTNVGGQRKLVRLSNGTLFAVYNKKIGAKLQIYIKKSDDNGTTWTWETHLSNSAGMDIVNHVEPAIAVDSLDNLHVVWDADSDGNDEIFYTTFNTSWSIPLKLSTLAGMDIKQQQTPSIAVDSKNQLHVVWYGELAGYGGFQIWYNKYITSWSGPTRISTYPDMNLYAQNIASVSVDGKDYIYVIWGGYAQGYPNKFQTWVNTYTTNWGGPVRISTYPGMDIKDQYLGSIAVDSNDFIYATWFGQAGALSFQIWVNNYTTTWGTPVRISTYPGMDTGQQYHPSIAIDNNDTKYVVWYGKADPPFAALDTVFGANYTNSWNIPEGLQYEKRSSFPTLRWARWPEPGDVSYFITDENGTIVEDDLEDIEDAYDWIDDEMDPDPLDPDPPGWVTEGPFTRFKMRLYLLVIGYGCVWGPIWFFCWRRPSGYYICGGALVMLMGLGLLIQIVYV